MGESDSKNPAALPSDGTRASTGGPLAFTFGNWFTWTAIGVAFPVLGLFLVGIAGLLAEGAFETLATFATAHVATLGWGTLTIMGGAMQMAPALFGARVRAERSVPWQYGLFVSSLLLMIVGFTTGNFALVATGGLGVNLASWWFIVLLVSTMVAAGSKRAMVSPHIPAALLWFVLVLIWGTVLAANLRWAFWPALLAGYRGLVVHLTLGLGGWFGLMVVGTFYRLVPLVHGARVANPRRGWGILALATLAVGAVMAGVAWGIGGAFRTAAVLAAGGLGLFAWEVLHVLAHRRSRAPDLNVAHWHAVVAYSAVLASVGVGWGLGWLGSDPPSRLGECVVVLFLLGWVTQAIVGQLYKVTPFLMWYYRATMPDVQAIPRQPAPYNPPLGRAVLWLSNLGTLGLAAGILLNATRIAQGGAVLLTVAAFALAYLLAYRWIPAACSRALTFEWRWRIS